MRTLHMKGRKLMMQGGSILLSRGGPGAGSSYDSPEEYKSITGKGLGMGVGGLGLFAGGSLSNLQQLKPKSLSQKPKNISFG